MVAISCDIVDKSAVPGGAVRRQQRIISCLISRQVNILCAIRQIRSACLEQIICTIFQFRVKSILCGSVLLPEFALALFFLAIFL